MSLLIKGMEMPTSCYACDFAYQDQDSEHNVYWTCAVDHKAAGLYERREDCPLIEIPSHGRLIDADALPDRYAEVRDLAPTIIEAEYSPNSEQLVQEEEKK